MDASCLRCLRGCITVPSYSAEVGVGEREARADLEFLVGSGVGLKQDNRYCFDSADMLSAALLLLGRGEPLERISAELDWRSFEGLAARILESCGYITERNLVLRSPRAEIDVVATGRGVALLVDCKHWMRLSPSQATRAARMQARRAKLYALSGRTGIAVPAIVALQPDVEFAAGVPIVAISKLGGFADELPGRLDEVVWFSPDQNSS